MISTKVPRRKMCGQCALHRVPQAVCRCASYSHLQAVRRWRHDSDIFHAQQGTTLLQSFNDLRRVRVGLLITNLVREIMCGPDVFRAAISESPCSCVKCREASFPSSRRRSVLSCSSFKDSSKFRLAQSGLLSSRLFCCGFQSGRSLIGPRAFGLGRDYSLLSISLELGKLSVLRGRYFGL